MRRSEPLGAARSLHQLDREAGRESHRPDRLTINLLREGLEKLRREEVVTALTSRINEPAISLHSLRHMVTQKLVRARTYPPIQNRLLGHAIGKSVEEKVYMGSMEYSAKELSEALEKIKLPCL